MEGTSNEISCFSSEDSLACTIEPSTLENSYIVSVDRVLASGQRARLAEVQHSIVIGDIDWDSLADAEDLNVLTNALAQPGAYEETYGHTILERGDLNADGRVDDEDVRLLRKFVSGT